MIHYHGGPITPDTCAIKAWKGAYSPSSKETRASLLVERIESHNSASSLNYCEEKDRFDYQLQLAV